MTDIHGEVIGQCKCGGVVSPDHKCWYVPVAPAPTASAREDEPSIQDALRIAAQINEAYGRNRAEATSIIRKLFRDYASSQSSKLEGVGQEAAEKIWAIFPKIVYSHTREQSIQLMANVFDELIAGRLEP